MSESVTGRTGGGKELDLPRVRMQILAGKLAAVLIIVAVSCLTVRADGPKALNSRYSAFRTFRSSPAEPVEPAKEPERSTTTGTALFGPSRDTWPVSTMANGATTEEILLRLEAAEAEIRTLRQQGATPNLDSEFEPLPPGKPPELEAPPSDDEPIILPILTPLIMGSIPCSCEDGGAVTFKPGARMQTRYVYDDLTNNNDIFLTRFRLKSGGDAFGLAAYYMELKFDSTGKFETEARGNVENAWLDFPLTNVTCLIEESFVRVGLYDVPFSRNALTSDSKLLFMDRSLVKDELTEKGMADNTIGAMLHGRPGGGRIGYMIGLFDNVAFENTIEENFENSTALMTAGRITLNLLDPETPPSGYADYRGSYIGQGQRLDIGTNYAYLPRVDEEAEDLVVPDAFTLYAWGVDIFYNCGVWVFQAEYDIFVEDFHSSGPELSGDGWYVQGGCFVLCCRKVAFEVAARHQQINPEDDEDRRRWTSIGLNTYIRDHHLKIQSEYTFREEQEFDIDNDVFQVQLQFDY